MIAALLRVGWLTLKRDRFALILTFVLPIVFFSVFALVFGRQGRSEIAPIPVVIVDEDGSDASSRFVEGLLREPGLRARAAEDGAAPLDRAAAEGLVRRGAVPVAIILRSGFGAGFGGSFGAFAVPPPSDDAEERGAPVAIAELLVDSADPMATPIVSGLLQKVAMTAAPDLVAERGIELFSRFGGELTMQQRAAIATMRAALRPESAGGRAAPGATAAGPFAGPVPVRTVDVLGDRKTSGMVGYFAAGTAVMFLLFSMSGAAGTLLDDEADGTLERTLATGVGLARLLGAKWVFHALVGVVQICAMFLWAALLFRLELLSRLPGFILMTLATAGAASAFGLLLAGLCRTRAQLSGLATVVILIMSAIGGSMFPRRFLPEWAQAAGNATFNAWAVDGYERIFWYDQPTWSIWPQLCVLVGLTIVFLALARLLARRWDAR
ncbi:MAG TPA: ABC transporter permease [Phycisphaerales bacterium]|nr:ABC transporter permease [Phycisphaerales bacterium]HMP36611.1 ABC transporter permease [Phycisphaerales bacterium]